VPGSPAWQVLGDPAQAATTSDRLRKLADAGLLVVEPHGRYRYYQLAGPDVGRLIEALQQLAPAAPVRSLREGTISSIPSCGQHLSPGVSNSLKLPIVPAVICVRMK
jgi:hypothetical protein